MPAALLRRLPPTADPNATEMEVQMTYNVGSRLRNLAFPLFMTASFLTWVVPPRVGFWLSKRGGDLAYLLLPKRRRVTAENLARVMGKPAADPAVRRSVRVNMQNYGCLLYETVRVPHQSLNEILGRVRVHSEETIHGALAHGKGAIFVSAHFGNMELGGIAVASKTSPLTVPGTPLDPPRLMDQLTKQRLAKGVRMTVHSGAPRDVLKALRNNEIVGFCVDVGVSWQDGNTVPVSFFGKTAPFPPGLALLALRTGAPIVPAFAIVRPDHSVDVQMLDPIFAKPSGDKVADVQDCMQKVALCLERFIRAHPDQWYMYRPMWHASPEPLTSPMAPLYDKPAMPC